MKRYTIILSLVLSVLMIAALFCGCGRGSKEIEALAGTWYMTKSGPESVAQALLEYIGLCAEEIACVDLTTLPGQILHPVKAIHVYLTKVLRPFHLGYVRKFIETKKWQYRAKHAVLPQTKAI